MFLANNMIHLSFKAHLKLALPCYAKFMDSPLFFPIIVIRAQIFLKNTWTFFMHTQVKMLRFKCSDENKCSDESAQMRIYAQI